MNRHTFILTIALGLVAFGIIQGLPDATSATAICLGLR